jgi:Transposase IS116/IS110/IS902 family
LTETVLIGLVRRKLRADAGRDQAVRQAEIRRLALALRQARRDLKANHDQLRTIVDDLAPGLTDRYGVGPVTAAQAVVSFSHPGRCRTEAAFAALAGTSPLPASSGRTVRHRLNRGGDRALNCAIHTIALTRTRGCPRTRAYIQRRTAEGKTPREIRRCLKRYIARELYRQLTARCNRRTGLDKHRSVRRLGVRVPSGAQTIKAVTSRNAVPSLDSLPSCAAIFHILGPWCSDGAPLFRGGLCRRVLTSAFACRLVWITVRLRLRTCPLWALLWISVVTRFPLRLAILTCGRLTARAGQRARQRQRVNVWTVQPSDWGGSSAS